MEKTWGLVIALAVFQPRHRANNPLRASTAVNCFPYQVIW
jgi:hypothetical protein